MKRLVFLCVMALFAITLFSCSSEKSYKATFLEKNDKQTSVTYKENETVVFPTIAAVEGFNSLGWSLEPNGQVVTEYVMKAENVTFYAIYEKALADVKVKFIQKEVAEQVIDAKEGSLVNFIDIEPVEGFEAKGWSLTDGGEVVDSYVLENSDVTFYAVYEKIDYSPVITEKIVHWVPGAVNASVTVSVDAKGASVSESDLQVKLDDVDLVMYSDYELENGEFALYGDTLTRLASQLGEYSVSITTALGSASFKFHVIDNPTADGSTIPTKTIQGINMDAVASYVPSSKIEGAPDLLITEVRANTTMYTYIEVFNNTEAEYNLKGHRIVYGDVSSAKTRNDIQGLMKEPLGMAGAAYIYNDCKIPALSSAIIWLVTSYPWVIKSDKTIVENCTHVLTESDTAKDGLFDWEGGNLSVSNFIKAYGMDEDRLIFPVRCNNMLFNNTSQYVVSDGLGAPVAKSGSNLLNSINPGTNNRMIQIQKIDQDTHFTTDLEAELSSGIAPVGATYFRYEMDVVNKEEDLYANGQLDTTKVKVYGKRQCVNGLYFRKAYYNNNDELLGYAQDGNATMDLYNASAFDKDYQKAAYEEAVTPIVNALLFLDIDSEDGKWGNLISLEYTIPQAGSICMRFIPRRDAELSIYEDWFKQIADDKSEHIAFKLTLIAPCVAECLADKELVVPVSADYPTTYLSSGLNTVNKVCWFNFFLTIPE